MGWVWAQHGGNGQGGGGCHGRSRPKQQGSWTFCQNPTCGGWVYDHKKGPTCTACGVPWGKRGKAEPQARPAKPTYAEAVAGRAPAEGPAKVAADVGADIREQLLAFLAGLGEGVPAEKVAELKALLVVKQAEPQPKGYRELKAELGKASEEFRQANEAREKACREEQRCQEALDKAKAAVQEAAGRAERAKQLVQEATAAITVYEPADVVATAPLAAVGAKAEQEAAKPSEASGQAEHCANAAGDGSSPEQEDEEMAEQFEGLSEDEVRKKEEEQELAAAEFKQKLVEAQRFLRESKRRRKASERPAPYAAGSGGPRPPET